MEAQPLQPTRPFSPISNSHQTQTQTHLSQSAPSEAQPLLSQARLEAEPSPQKNQPTSLTLSASPISSISNPNRSMSHSSKVQPITHLPTSLPKSKTQSHPPTMQPHSTLLNPTSQNEGQILTPSTNYQALYPKPINNNADCSLDATGSNDSHHDSPVFLLNEFPPLHDSSKGGAAHMIIERNMNNRDDGMGEIQNKLILIWSKFRFPRAVLRELLLTIWPKIIRLSPWQLM